MRAMQRCRWDEAAARFGAVDGTSTRERFSNRHDFHYEGIYGRLIRALITDSTVEVAEKWKRVMQFFSVCFYPCVYFTNYYLIISH
jgi:hypothetical protein